MDNKALTKLTSDGLKVHSFQTLLGDKNISAFDMLTQPTAIQQRAFDLLGVPCDSTDPPSVGSKLARKYLQPLALPALVSLGPKNFGLVLIVEMARGPSLARAILGR
ncbi:MAG: hypothetical protein ACRD4O_12445 [Bryobacteraceae bacterium]